MGESHHFMNKKGEVKSKEEKTKNKTELDAH
jgi:hypothetical protein